MTILTRAGSSSDSASFWRRTKYCTYSPAAFRQNSNLPANPPVSRHRQLEIALRSAPADWDIFDRRQILFDDFDGRLTGERKQPEDVEIFVWVHLDVEDLRVTGHGSTG